VLLKGEMLKRFTSLTGLFLAAFCMTLGGATKKASAAAVEIVQTGVATGLVGNVSFSGANFTLTGFSDTSTRTPFSVNGTTGYFIFNSSSSIVINGAGTFQILSPTSYFVNNTNQIAGFDNDLTTSPLTFPENQVDLFYSPIRTALATWNMATSIGPLVGTGELLQWGDDPVQTDGGIIHIVGQSTNSSFQAFVTVPEPASISLLVLGSFALMRRRSRRVAL
jgi:hypothetical protein